LIVLQEVLSRKDDDSEVVGLLNGKEIELAPCIIAEIVEVFMNCVSVASLSVPGREYLQLVGNCKGVFELK
jgi:hypothetical protein